MGRKPLPPAKRRSAWIKLRVTDGERAGLQAQAERAGLTLSDYLRSQGLDAKA